MTLPRLPQYEGAGESGFASLVGGLLNGAQAGYNFRTNRRHDQQAEADRVRNQRRQDIEDQMRRDEAGYDVTDGPGSLVENQPEPTHPGHAPMDEDPRDFGGGTAASGGIIGYDQNSPESRPVDNPFTIPGQGLRSAVGQLVQGGQTLIRKTHESAAERLARIATDRQVQLEGMRTANARAEDQARLARESTIHDVDNARAERIGAANNRTSIEVARINADGRRDVADIRGSAGGGGGNGPEAAQMRNLITKLKDDSGALQRAIDGAQKAIPPLGKFATRTERADHDKRYGSAQRRIDSLVAQKDSVEAKSREVTNRMLSGITDVSDIFPGGPKAGSGAGSPPPSGERAGPSFSMDAERQQADAAIRRVMDNPQFSQSEKQRRIAAIQQRFQQRSGGR